MVGVGVVACDGDGGAGVGKVASRGVGVVGESTESRSCCAVPLACSRSGDFGDVASGWVGGRPSSSFVTRLAFRPFRPAGGGFTANSCAPGIGGGRKDEEGEGKGDDDGATSRQIERGLRSGCGFDSAYTGEAKCACDSVYTAEAMKIAR